MTKRGVLLSIVFGSMLAITGCGDDGGGGDGTGATNGTGATGGGGGGSASSTCEAICGANCIFGGVTPGADFGGCVSVCETEAPELNDNCGPEAESYIDCLVANDCSFTALDCVNQAQAWSNCQGG